MICKYYNLGSGVDPNGFGRCAATGDPHYTTLDGLKFDYQGTCEYYMIKMRNKPKSSPEWFAISAVNEHRRGKTRVAYVKQIRIAFGTTEVILGYNLQYKPEARVSEDVSKIFSVYYFSV